MEAIVLDLLCIEPVADEQIFLLPCFHPAKIVKRDLESRPQTRELTCLKVPLMWIFESAW